MSQSGRRDEFQELFTIEELDARTDALRADSRVTIQDVGRSRCGRPINMISIGEGDRDALVVGVPHANEPIGAATVERMISELLSGVANPRGYRWHFIKAIDPEGLRLNEPWLKRPRRVLNYLEHYFRSALDLQPEMTFPLDVPGASFHRSTPENLAWQAAFEATRPALHASLHHCDVGGAFCAASRPIPDLFGQLDSIIEKSGLTNNEYADGMIISYRLSRSVSLYPAVPEILRRAEKTGANWASPWSWGEMSPGYGEREFGTFTIITEVPLWDVSAIANGGFSRWTVADHVKDMDRLVSTASATIERHTPALAELAANEDDREYAHALEDIIRINELTHTKRARDSSQLNSNIRMSRREFVQNHIQFALFALRGYGLLIGLARRILELDQESELARVALEEAHSRLCHELDLISADALFTPIPLARSTSVQIEAIFACADSLGRN